MKKRIEFMGYCRDGDRDWISVQRRGTPKHYNNITKSTMQRFEDLQDSSSVIMFTFDLEDKDVDIQISMFFKDQSNDI